MSDGPSWDDPQPKAPLAPGLKMGKSLPSESGPKLELEQVEQLSDEDLSLIEQNKKLRRENDELMEQIENAWAVIKSRDELIESLRSNR